MKKATASSDVNPQPMKFGQWVIRPLNVNTLILLEKIGSPFMSDEFDSKTNRYKDGSKLTMEEMIRSFYVMVNSDDPRLDDIIGDPIKLNRCVSDMARNISMADLAKMSTSVGQQMTRVNDAIKETGAEGDGSPKKAGGQLS